MSHVKFSALINCYLLMSLRFYSPINAVKIISSRSVKLLSLFLGRLRYGKVDWNREIEKKKRTVLSPANCVCGGYVFVGGYTVFTSSVRPSVCSSATFCFLIS